MGLGHCFIREGRVMISSVVKIIKEQFCESVGFIRFISSGPNREQITDALQKVLSHTDKKTSRQIESELDQVFGCMVSVASVWLAFEDACQEGWVKKENVGDRRIGARVFPTFVYFKVGTRRRIPDPVTEFEIVWGFALSC
jgi:hypothetical protein